MPTLQLLCGKIASGQSTFAWEEAVVIEVLRS